MKSRDNYYFKQATRTREQNILNLSYGQFESDNDMGIPIIKNQDISISEIDNSKLIGFNFAKTTKETKTKGLHFFLHDYQFERVWNFPTRYLEILKNYKYILSPDFSPYADTPKAIQIFNLYRNRWCGRYWQENGIKVIPTITIGNQADVDLFLTGVEKGCPIAISTMGEGRWANYKLLYSQYEKIVQTLNPLYIVMYGKDLSTQLNLISDCKIIYKPYSSTAGE